MTNDEARRNDEIRMTKKPDAALRHSDIRASFDIRHSGFVICGASAPLHLPIFDEFVWDFFQESRWPLENVAVAAGQAHVRISEIKLVFRSGDRDVKQTPLFFQIFPLIH